LGDFVMPSGLRIFTLNFAGSRIVSDVALPELTTHPAGVAPTIAIRIARQDADPAWDKTGHLVQTWGSDPAAPQLFASPDGAHYRLRFPRQAEFLIAPDAALPIVVHYRALRAGLGDVDLRHLLLDHVLPRVLAHAGHMMLHGALLHVGGVGIAILGPSGAGKSTLAAALTGTGAELLSDDGLLIEARRDGIWATATYPSLRLWPDSLAKLYATPPVTSPMAVRSAKRRVHAHPGAPGSVPLGCVFVLDGAAEGGPSLSPVSPAQACMTLVANTFQLDPSDPVVAGRALALIRRLVIQVPVHALRYPRRFEGLPAVCERIHATCSDAAACDARLAS
jgi:hypothetical protein